MRSQDIRQQYLEFFKSKDHTVVRGSPLYLSEEPSLLFINAGMNQFKPIFLDKEKPKYRRVVNAQRCMRVSGKHNDLDEVGISPHHHTLFEMLGNWSFGDYYKRETITWAWELLSSVWNLPKEKLWVTVFQDDLGEIPRDDEAALIWTDETGIDPDHILYFGRKDNFWEMGDTGPCGPCTEIHIDRGPDFCNLSHRADHVCSVNGDCRRFTEIWNLVFIQYHKDEQGRLGFLPEKHVDTGMGLERITAVMQNAPSNYATDLFVPILDTIAQIGNHDETIRNRFVTPYQVIADHARAGAFLIADGVLPSNEWRGYVLRRIIRRAVRFGKKMGFSDPFLHQVAMTVVDIMRGPYPELETNRLSIQRTLEAEEERFFKTLNQGLPMVMELIESVKAKSRNVIPGNQVFKLYDTYGFPLDITLEIAHEEGLKVDEAGFQRAMETQKERARNAWKPPVTDHISSEVESLLKTLPPTRFEGYRTLETESSIRAILIDDRPAKRCSPGQEASLIIDPSPFYAESGGQVGDTGFITTGTACFEVENTVKITLDRSAVLGRPIRGTLETGETVKASVDANRRASTARNHTATHLLHAALRKVLGDHVKQSGSMVSPERLRFDFTHFTATESHELERIENLVNRAIMANSRVDSLETDLEQALKMDAVALFGEKYGERVRVIQIDRISNELCGGTHVRHTGDIGLFTILSESSIAAGVRRIEAVTGEAALEKFQKQKQLLHLLATALKSDEELLPDRIDRLLQQTRQHQKDIHNLSMKIAEAEITSTIPEPLLINGVKVVLHRQPGLDPEQIRDLTDKLKDRIGEGIVLLGTDLNGKVHLVMAVTRSLTDRFHAGKLIGQIAALVGGGGGGRPDMAQAGGTKPEELGRAFEKVPEIIQAWSESH
ncbi:alanine--tRNA ligase [bacterium]|nr:alanine--tRNA ligase [candidate division CSSED10-310 bacterium]